LFSLLVFHSSMSVMRISDIIKADTDYFSLAVTGTIRIRCDPRTGSRE
jgi:hypothetical protein